MTLDERNGEKSAVTSRIAELARQRTIGGGRPWPWTQRDVVHLVVTTVGADGERRRWYADLHTGPERGETIRLPAGTRIVRIERHRRMRVELGKLRARHRHGDDRPRRP